MELTLHAVLGSIPAIAVSVSGWLSEPANRVPIALSVACIIGGVWACLWFRKRELRYEFFRDRNDSNELSNGEIT